MSFEREAVFPMIPQPISLAADALSGGSSTRRSPVPSNLVDTGSSRPGRSKRSAMFNEDVFSHVIRGPFLVVHFGLWFVVPVTYLVYFSPFALFEPGALHQSARWALLFLVQCLTAVVMVSWDGHYRTRRELAAILLTGGVVLAAGALKGLVDGVVMQMGQG